MHDIASLEHNSLTYHCIVLVI